MRRRPASAIGAWLLSVLTGDPQESDRQMAVIRAHIEAMQFAPAQFVVIRAVFEALIGAHMPADPEAEAVNALARDAVAMGGEVDLIATAAVIRRALSTRAPEPRYLGFGDEIDKIWLVVTMALVRRHRVGAARIRALVLQGEKAAAEWKPPVFLTPAAPKWGAAS